MSRVLRLVLSTGAAKLLTTFGSIAFSFYVARKFGAQSLGEIALLTSLVGLGVIVCRNGWDVIILREVSIRRDEIGTKSIEKSIARVLYDEKYRLLIVLLAGFAFAHFFGGNEGAAQLGIALALTTSLMLIVSLYGSYYKAIEKPWLGVFFDVGGVSLCALAVLFAFQKLTGLIDPVTAFMLGAVTISLPFLWPMARAFWMGGKRGIDAIDPKGYGRNDITLTAATSFLLHSGCFILAAPFLSVADLGLLRGAERVAIAISYAGLIVNPVVAPSFAVMHSRGQMSDLQSRLVTIMVILAIVAAAAALVVSFFAGDLLYLFGADFLSATPLLYAFAFIHFVVALSYPLAMFSTMAGREASLRRVGVSVLLLGVLTVPVISLNYGAVGFTCVYGFLLLIRFGLLLNIARSVINVQSTQLS